MTIRSALLCDTCPNVFVAEQAGSNSALTRQAAAAGWTSRKNHDDHWSNVCDECAPEREQTNTGDQRKDRA